jgi:hypothetical protein
VKRQVENALNVTAREIGKMEQGKRSLAQFNVLSVGIVGIDSVNQQSYLV